ncbi:dynein beta chain, ciliary-like isoform X2 [Toxorhynchites rutilus septentrionalis]|uniref:dynein beta chain, ciliary-like isoform X2 n=1 Tax=Toxorhynchites rutilus septentrionalis TaxID=329112 RepID=UPI00247B00D3|nr:dynein beta chain, ciliary-like isoform X2 [Toxorhynchites rutilus septentrionalis]
MGDDKKKKEEKEDPCAAFVGSYVLKTMRLKDEKWQKLMGNEEFKVIVMEWVKRANVRRLIVTLNNAGALIPTHFFPTAGKGKRCFFVKVKETVLDIDNIREQIMYGDLSANPIDDLAVIVDEIFYPIISNPRNQEGWPDVIKKDVDSHFQDLRNIITEVKGNIINQTLLPMPISIGEVESVGQQISEGNIDGCTLKMKNSLEGIVIKWAYQINDVLKEDSTTIFKDGHHPSPLEEISFWDARQSNLRNIYSQLLEPRVHQIGVILEGIDSVYYSSFKSTFQSVVQAVHEADDVTLFLMPLKKHFETFESTEFTDAMELIAPMLHCVCLLWAHSFYYGSNARIMILFKMISNMMITEASKCLDPGSLFQGEPDECLLKINTVIDNIVYYKEQFHDFRGQLDNFRQLGSQPTNWTFRPQAIFDRLDLYLARLDHVKDIFYTATEFRKLEKVEIGGLRGRGISRKIQEVFEDFNKLYLRWGSIQYDPLDPDPAEKSFERDRARYQQKTDVLERKLAAQFVLAFDECYNVEQLMKLVQIMGTLISRSLILPDIHRKISNIVHLYNNDLNIVKKIFDEGRAAYEKHGLEGMPIDTGFPPVAGAILWVHKLRDRISKPINDLSMVEYPLFKNENDEIVMKNYHEMMKYLDTFEATLFKEWSSGVSKKISTHMGKALLIRNDKQLLEMNFNQTLVMILLEIRYMKRMGLSNIPDKALNFSDLEEALWQARLKLMRIVEWYNEIVETSVPCERELIQKEVAQVDKIIEMACSGRIDWNNYDPVYIDEFYDRLKNLHTRVLKAQNNIKKIVDSIRSWGQVPLYQRKDGGSTGLLDIDDRSGKVQRRLEGCFDTKKKIDIAMEQNFRYFFNLFVESQELISSMSIKKEETRESLPQVGRSLEERLEDGGESSQATEDTEEKVPSLEQVLEFVRTPSQLALYRPYQEYVDSIVSSEILDSIRTSVRYIKFEMENRLDHNAPIFEIKYELHPPRTRFVPTLDAFDSNGFLALVEGLLTDIYCMCTIPRVAQPPDNDPRDEYGEIILATYLDHLESQQEIEHMKDSIINRVIETIREAEEYIQRFDDYNYLWLDDRHSVLEQFLKYGRPLTPDEMEMLLSAETPLREVAPSLDQFKVQIDSYYDLYDQIFVNMDIAKTFDVWLSIDLRHFKTVLLLEISKWSNLFKKHLIDRVVDSLNELQEFANECDEIFILEAAEEDFPTLLKILSALNKLKERENMYDNMFEPLKATVDLLKGYNVEFDEIVYKQFAELPERWLHIKKTATKVREKIAPAQAYQVDLIRKRITLFDIRSKLYREGFKKLAFFKVPCENVYQMCNQVNLELNIMETQMKNLCDSAALFELNPPDDNKLRLCRKEIRMVKQIWDFVYAVESCVNDWKKTPWKKIDVEAMEMECKNYGKQIRQLDKDMRTWNPYVHVEAVLKNLLTSLRAITELQNPAIRERHWIELMQATKVRFRMDDSTTLADLLELNLHNYEEEVKTIVDKSVKEMGMEKVLRDLEVAWRDLAFEDEQHERTGLRLIKVSEEVIEMLEENQVQLQNLMSSKYIAFFLAEVSKWQLALSNADQVITAWFEVQRKWMYLESIFIGSEDIRSQLPEDSKRFDGIDREFKKLLEEIVANPNIVKATNKQGLYEKLETLLTELVLCEKALNDYLETKRLAYPRFYFVSSADLLDILSNGNQPELVAKHLTKLYDSLAKLVFSKLSKKSAVGMISKENEEYVAFKNNCDCSGKVEIWLNRVTDSMRVTLHNLFEQAVIAYEEKPRDHWIFDWPAQPALCATQIWWTTEVNVAFARLEEGYENALKDYQKKQILQLNALIVLLCGDLSQGDRQKIMTICTIDVHSRDVVAKMIQQKVETGQAFQWQSQLRHRWDDQIGDCFANICDAQFRYDYEYLGNTPRLVITPLTDRCYITLTQSLHLIMGGAPAGPAGTGKTETTKDLGRALGIMVYVFNCSEQMDYKSCGNIYKGLSQTGAWGCFDEFNRISVEVLSVVAVQVKSIQDAIKGEQRYATLSDIKGKKEKFNFMGEIISLIPTVGIFITMNPGYAGRTELPENLKALFRPCAMVVPDFELICEIMLVAEGFQEARLLARKFITLYTLCKELLSKQDHYDWGLRAIKSVLVVAGALKRGDRERPEDQVLMRALRDFNVPKIVTDDVPVFMGLIGDLFPALDVPRKRSPEFERLIRKSATELKLQPEDSFILKVVQLEELFAVRHSVFIVGFAGTGKTQVWKTLFRTYQNQKRKPHFNDLDPKAVTNDELFGIINPATREWKDGLFSVIMRDQANMGGTGPKWIVLDGDIDPMWIESLNTVMDDNKVLTLASNERIALTKEMRLLFEISNLRTATPATVSRAGILYINPQDLGWNPFVASWIDSRETQAEKSILSVLFDKYIPPLIDAQKRFKKITPISEIAMIQMTCHLLDCLLTPQNLPPDSPKEWYEIYYVFAVIWGFGSSMFQDQMVDWRNEFHKWWINEFKAIRFPPGGTVFNYYIDPETKKFNPWTDLVPSFDLDTDIPLQSTLVPTAETTRLRWFMDILIEAKHPVMLIGGAGSGKSVIVADKLNNLSYNYAVTNVPFNFYTTSEMLQRVLEKPLEKKAGRNYGPPGSKTMVYFVDDMNMPEVDTYGTVQPHTLIRQFMDYRHWYDRTKLTLKDIHNCQFVSCMNPTAGSFTIDPRLQRHFCVFAVSFPAGDPLYHIYYSILSQHLANPLNKFTLPTQKICASLVSCALTLHLRMGQTFLPTAIKFHYVFNLRDLANIFQGMLFANGETCPDPNSLIRLWVHEATRVYSDKLVEDRDIETYRKLRADVVKKSFEEFDEGKVFSSPIIYCHFAEGLVDPKYMPVANWESLNKTLEEAQANYNDMIGAMNLVLFEDAMSHVCRISRILEGPRGNALLIGVGGSGKQSLSRLAAFISGLEVSQIQLRKGYGIADLKADLAVLYMKTGVKNVPCMFLMTDAQVAEEAFLVLINDLLASGEIPELFPEDEIDNIVNALRNEVKQLGMLDTKENCWKYFIDKVRKSLKIVLCFSPVGSTLRIRARKFPALVNCTAINWFHEWPKTALESVSNRFLAYVDVMPRELVEPVAVFMAYVHGTVNEMSQIYLQNERRYNYTTPKSFLELIALYSKFVKAKHTELNDRVQRLESGILKLAECADQVDSLQVQLVEQEVVLKKKNQEADKLIKVVGAENEKVQKEKNFAAEEEKKVRVIEEDVSAKAKICEEDLRKAEPALLAAQAALDTLDKNNLTELKSFGSPPELVVKVCAAVLVLFSPKGRIPKDRSWKSCKLMMNKVDVFLNDLIYYDKEHIQPDVIKALQEYLKDPDFDPEKIRSKSAAAAGLCAWVINIHKFYQVYQVVEPKQRALNEAQAELKAAQDKLMDLTNMINELEERLGVIQAEFNDALAEKQKCQDEADKTAFTIDLAHRLVNGLASENVRWRESIALLKSQTVTLPGDVLLIACFISYVGCFTRRYRVELQENMWIPTFRLSKPAIPFTEGVDPLNLIVDDAVIASWNNEGLPSDRMSSENAAILTYSARWPLMIDPQLQGIKWIKQKYGNDLTVLRLTAKGYLDVIERCVSNGSILLIENIGETIDAVLDPLLGRMLVKKGKCLRMGEKEIDYNPNFQLILQTKLANPHYKPEMQAQTTLINFTVTRDGLEEQLLAEVVKAERPDLEQQKADLTMQQNTFKITLKMLEDDLLSRLSSAGENVLEDASLVLNLEKTKKTAAEVEVKVREGKKTSEQIDVARESYRPAAERASILYFILNDLHKINPIYQFSLKAFTIVFKDAIAGTPSAEKLKDRVFNLIDSITFAVHMYTSRGLFERDKLIFMAQMAIQILLQAKEIDPAELDFLLRFPFTPNLTSPFDFLTNAGWGGIKALSNMDEFRSLDKDIEGSAKRWRKLVESECPEREKMPGEWKNKNALQRLCIVRCLRPDRMTYAVRAFVEEKLGAKFVEARMVEFDKSFQETSSSTPVFFILSPGVDPLKDVEKLGKKMRFSTDHGNFYNVSLGQGQEVVAESAIDVASKEGHWVILQNIHLVAKWLPTLEKKMEATLEDSHDNYRLFISAEPAMSAEYHIIPQGILESAIKITNEPPTGMLANIHKALDNFNQETLEMCGKEAEFKAILFSLCYFHAVVAERRKFGPQGWNRVYPFNVGDLTISVYVLFNYLEANNRVPWEDLRYLFGEIMYGGHITDDWDRRLCRTYLEELMQPELVDGDLNLCAGFPAPPNLDYVGYHNYIDDNLPVESPYLYGLHPNAEIGFLTTLSEQLFKTIFELQPRDSGATSGSTVSREDVVKTTIEDFTDKLPEEFNMAELMARVEDRTPFVIVAFQECERMNILVREMKRSLRELMLGLKGELTITSDMEDLEASLFFDHVPDSWTRRAYPSMFGLQSWFADLTIRIKELEAWSNDFNLPSTVWLAGFFNPQSFLTAIMQQTARKNEWPLDKMCLSCDVTKKWKEDISAPPREGAYVTGLYMEGARWDTNIGSIASSRLKELFPQMPVIFIKAITQDKQETKNIYECPVYKTRDRGPTYVWTFNLKSKEKPAKWTLGGVCLLLQV